MTTQSDDSRFPAHPLLVALLLGVLFLSTSALALDPPYLNEMPPVDRVLREIQGKNALDTVARQNGALRQLMNMIDVIAGKRLFRLTRDEQRIKGAYSVVFSKMEQETLNSFDPAETRRLGMKSPRAQWWELETAYSHDAALRSEILQRFFSPAWQANFKVALEQDARDLRAIQNRQAQTLRAPSPFDPVVHEIQQVFPGVPPIAVLGIGIGGSLLLLAWCLQRELRPFGLDPSNPSMVQAGNKRFQVQSSTGIVRSPTKALQTQTHVTTDQQGHVSSSSSTTVHLQFFIQEPNGTERSVQLVNVDLAVREGHLVSAAWLGKEGTGAGPYFLFLNHSTGDQHYLGGILAAMFRMRWMRSLLLLAILMLFLPPFFMNTFLIPIAVIVFILKMIANRSRRKRFEKEGLPIIITALVNHAKGQPQVHAAIAASAGS